MTRLFNLESCVECYQYARLFEKSPVELVPVEGDLPKEYKKFLHSHANVAYLPEPVLAHSRSQELEIKPSTLESLSIGTQLNQGDEQLFIIRDTVDLMTLVTGGFLGYREKYLYASAYHYWNHISEFSRRNLTKPLVFIDLDSFGGDRLIPICFGQPENSPYPVPILDTRHENLTLDFDAATTYESICQVVAGRILSDTFAFLATNSSTVSHLAQYLQRISFFHYIQYHLEQQRDSFNLIIEIFHQGEIFYKDVTVQVSPLQAIILEQLNIQAFKQLASKYPELQFALVSNYPVLPQLQNHLPEFIILQSNPQDFRSIWQQKRDYRFPLFGFYLDKIAFSIRIDAQEQWIQLSSQNEENLVSYEGEKRRFIGFIPSTGKEEFVIKQGITNARLPIQVNGKDYCVNGVHQDYYIEICDYDASLDVKVRIEFNLQPDSPPKLIVRDLHDKYRIKTELKERQKLNFSYIPSERIASTRQKESEEQIQKLQLNLDSLKLNLSHLNQKLRGKEASYQELEKLFKVAYEQVHKSSRFDPLQFINALTDNQVVKSLAVILSTGVISEEIPRWLTEYGRLNSESERLNAEHSQLNNQYKQLQNRAVKYNNNSSKASESRSTSQQRLLEQKNQQVLEKKSELNEVIQKRRSLSGLVQQAIMFLGKTYRFSQSFTVYHLFDESLMRKASDFRLGNEYLKMLTRVAVTEELQSQYFGFFTATYYGNKSAYQSDVYLWGYWRILRWYFAFKSSNNWFDYSQHFKLIVEYLLQADPNHLKGEYKQNSFSSLIYLLTFREIDPEFCRPGSEEMKMAQKVIERFRNDNTIRSIQVSKDKLLNEFFEQMVAGIATESDMIDLLSAS